MAPMITTKGLEKIVSVIRDHIENMLDSQLIIGGPEADAIFSPNFFPAVL